MGKIFFNHFVESIFVLNKCTAHPIYVSAARQGDGGSGIAVSFDGINLDGREGEARRRSMYDFLLSKLSDEEKITVTARFAKEVLGEAVDNEGDLSQVCKQLSPPNESSFTPTYKRLECSNRYVLCADKQVYKSWKDSRRFR